MRAGSKLALCQQIGACTRRGLGQRTGPHYISTAMTIVTSRHRPKRSPKLALAAAIKVPRVVEHSPRGRAWRVALEPDEAADRRVAQFMAKVIRPAE
jgi:hypothetical protein